MHKKKTGSEIYETHQSETGGISTRLDLEGEVVRKKIKQENAEGRNNAQ